MYNQLKELMGAATYMYGPTSREVAYSVPVQSWTTVLSGKWYVGTAQPVEQLANIEIPAPPQPVVDEQPLVDQSAESTDGVNAEQPPVESAPTV